MTSFLIVVDWAGGFLDESSAGIFATLVTAVVPTLVEAPQREAAVPASWTSVELPLGGAAIVVVVVWAWFAVPMGGGGLLLQR